jgi:hypothetical protein
MRKREKWFDPAHLRLAQQEREFHRQRLLDAAIETTSHAARKRFNGS